LVSIFVKSVETNRRKLDQSEKKPNFGAKFSNHHEIYDQLPTRSQFLGPTTVMKSFVFSQFTDFYQVYFGDALADADLASRIVDQFKTMKVRSPFYYYRIVEGSISRKNSSVRYLNQYKEIAFLSQQRRTKGFDCLMQN
jgi:hypothetical protein